MRSANLALSGTHQLTPNDVVVRLKRYKVFAILAFSFLHLSQMTLSFGYFDSVRLRSTLSFAI